MLLVCARVCVAVCVGVVREAPVSLGTYNAYESQSGARH